MSYFAPGEVGPINFRLLKEISSSRSFAEHKIGSASVYA